MFGTIIGKLTGFFRNHNDIGQIRQDPAAWPTVADATRQVYLFRYRYLPYLYTYAFAINSSFFFLNILLAIRNAGDMRAPFLLNDINH